MRLLLIILITVTYYGCDQYSKSDYSSWVESENGYFRIYKNKRFEIYLQYCPKNYLILNNKATVASDSIYFFELKLKPNEKLIKNGFSFNTSYFSFDFSNDIIIKENDLSCDISFIHMENIYNLSNSRQFFISVNKNDILFDEKLTLGIDSKIINEKMINFYFDLSQEPNVQL